MSVVTWVVLVLAISASVRSCEYGNATLQPAQRQLCEFGIKHPKPIGVLTTTVGMPVDLRDTITLNSDLFKNEFHLDTMLHFDGERIPERVVHAKGTAAIGYFEVTNDVSQYTKADVFNGIGKKTPLVVRMSTSTQSKGGPDVTFELKGMAIKFYTKEGNLDLLCLQTPVYLYKDPILFSSINHAFKRNPATNVFDLTSQWDFLTLKPTALHAFLWTRSDYGVPTSYRHMDAFPIHTYEVNNAKGGRYYVRFNFRTEQGLQSLVGEQLTAARQDIDYYTRDLYNEIAKKNYPSWKLELDVMSFDDIKHVDFDPFDVSRLWKNGTYRTVEVGRLVLNKNPDNIFRVAEMSAFNPASLVPGIPGPFDFIFRGRQLFYRDTQNYRLGRNHDKIEVNLPFYAKTYTRDGTPPVRHNMKDVPSFYPNSFNGPEPAVDGSRPSEKLVILESNAVDFEPASNFYKHVLNEAQRQRLANQLGITLEPVTEPTRGKAIKLLTLIDNDLGTRVRAAIETAAGNMSS